MRPALRSVCRLATALALLAPAVEAPRAQTGRTHDLTLRPENVHWGYYDATLKPVLPAAFSGCSPRACGMTKFPTR
jgi:hypothetical protein